jgi:hypothetical protein
MLRSIKAVRDIHAIHIIGSTPSLIHARRLEEPDPPAGCRRAKALDYKLTRVTVTLFASASSSSGHDGLIKDQITLDDTPASGLVPFLY